ncbi:DUF6082 family protein [Nonomuraea sp. B1E8]|uniref:DUF6082 family protein n=1 Tax=unclassified Nonomuraea TaxID=2593643 RepID=UPI00325D3236
MSDIGETYGAASAVLSALALIAIGASLFLQAREMKFSREEAERAHHFQLLQLQIENPVLSGAMHRADSGLDPRLHLYLNLVLSYWEMLFRVGQMHEPVLQEYARHDFLGTEVGRRFWEGTRGRRLALAKDRRSKQFVTVIDRAWRQTVETQGTQPPRQSVQKAQRSLLAALSAAAVTALVGVGITWLSRTKRMRADD